ncbi:hypothetical protein [Halorussus caseinilyticus]|uniref:Uncharacterized protein n=1 Tax=Halorussus caseinilyticus TaxID=3034025 RepID=A0ABD5WSZ4_9EURY|nr:hypothetical protein [Halorussus sp. DT72]
MDEWKLVRRSDGEEYLFRSGERRDVSDCPAELFDTVRSHLKNVDEIRVNETTKPVSESARRRLEELGYR